ncbi:MAG: catechol 2,3-dioxygenase [Propionibacterium sp.]|nr:catechol 2,3-dioxygenase [Propionibacterium sp.]
MGVMRMGFVHARVMNMEEAKDHYVNTLGFYPTHEEEGKLYLKGWDEWDHHSVILEEGGVGLVGHGYKVRREDDLAEIEKRAATFGATTERLPAGEHLEMGDVLRIHLPIGHYADFYATMTQVGNEVGYHNPDSFPWEARGIGAPHLDHALIVGDDMETTEKLFMDVLDFYPTERMLATMDEGAPLIATWLTAGNKSHDVAFLKGPDGKFHHMSFMLKDWAKVTDAADLIVHRDIPVDLAPTRHGITRGETCYFFDPSGNRNETFAGGYFAYPDRPVINWSMDQLGKGLDYYKREVTDSFLTVYT